MRHGKRSDYLYDHVFEQIVLGKWPVGKRIPTEKTLGDMFDVSRPIVREALARLRADGLIVSRQGSGSYISRQPDSHVLRFAQVGNIGELLRCYEFRVALEGEAAALAAQRRTADDITLLSTALDETAKTQEPVDAGIGADIAFHLAIARVSGNDFFLTTLRSLEQPMRYGMQLARRLHLEKPELGSFDDAQREHDLVFRSVRDGAVDLARASMRAHIENTRQRILGTEDGPPRSGNGPAPERSKRKSTEKAGKRHGGDGHATHSD